MTTPSEDAGKKLGLAEENARLRGCLEMIARHSTPGSRVLLTVMGGGPTATYPFWTVQEFARIALEKQDKPNG